MCPDVPARKIRRALAYLVNAGIVYTKDDTDHYYSYMPNGVGTQSVTPDTEVVRALFTPDFISWAKQVEADMAEVVRAGVVRVSSYSGFHFWATPVEALQAEEA